MKRILFSLVALSVLVSCSLKEDIVNATDSAQILSFYASAAEPELKTSLVEHSAVHWSENDQVKVGLFAAVTGYGLQSAVFTADFEGTSSSNAYFTTADWTISSTWAYDSYAIALYPADKVSMSQYASSGSNLKMIQYELPETQTPVIDGFANNHNLSFAVVSRDDLLNNNATLYFRNACALLRINLPEVTDLVSFTVNSASDTPLTGTPSNMTYSGTGQNATLIPSWGSGEPSVVLSDENGIAAGTYYLVVWPGSHNGGLTFIFTNSAGEICEKTFQETVTLTAGVIETFNFKSAIEFSPAVNVGDYFYSDGTTGSEYSSDAVGVVFYVGDPRSIDSTIPEGYANGLVVGLNELSDISYDSGPSLGLNTGYAPDYYYSEINTTGTSAFGNTSTAAALIELSRAYEMTQKHKTASSSLYETYGLSAMTDYGSGWYIPSCKEYSLMYENMSVLNSKEGFTALRSWTASDKTAAWKNSLSGSPSFGYHTVWQANYDSAWRSITYYYLSDTSEEGIYPSVIRGANSDTGYPHIGRAIFAF